MHNRCISFSNDSLRQRNQWRMKLKKKNDNIKQCAIFKFIECLRLSTGKMPTVLRAMHKLNGFVCFFFGWENLRFCFFSSLDVLLLLPVRLILMDPIEIGSKSKYYYRITNTITPNYGDSSSIHVIELTFDLKNKRRVIYIRCAVHFKKQKDAFTTKSKEENTHTHCSKRNTLKLIVILCFIESQFNSSQAINW